MQNVEFFPVVVTDYPTDTDHAPLLVDPAAARFARAGDIVEGDLILGGAYGLGRTVVLEEVEYPNEQYEAHPTPSDPACCSFCERAAEEPGEHVVVTSGYPWEVCDVWPVAAFVLIIPAALRH
ncbi:hypothetical protein ACGF4C_30475 [Streptomyces sp. NPDC048197]|uniref:hypothetical protein n=1 Tax=Streptomyces sp. NPDC048197 TaxID=3365511 RepID=UPI00371CA4E1